MIIFKKSVFIFFISLLLLSSCLKRGNKTRVEVDRHFENIIPIASEDQTTTFIVIGDWGYQGPALQAISDQMDALASYMKIDFIVTLGDNIYPEGVDSINDPHWEVYTENFNQESLQIPWYISIGNHDHYGNEQIQVDYSAVDERWYFPNFFYTKTRPINNTGDSLGLIVIDSYRLRANPNDLGQISWIDSVAEAMNSSWKIMIGHHPLYSYGYHGSDEVMQGLLESILNDNEIDLYLAGHDHDLQHIRTEDYSEFFISGSAGKIRDTSPGPYSLFSLSDYGFLTIRLSSTTLSCYFIDRDGRVVYNYQKVKP
jgi:hypothetical protein